MKVYKDYGQSPDGWNTESTLKLEYDGRFSYEEQWTDCTSVALYGGAEGRWRRDGSVVVFLAEKVEGSMYHPWVTGQELRARERGDALDFGRGCILRLLKPQTQAGEGARAPVAEPLKHAGKPPPAPPVAERKFPRFEPREPSPELAARIRLWIDETPADGLQYLCKENDAIWLHCTLIYLWLLRPDGQVLCIDHESFGRRAEPETDPVRAYAALAQGAREHPELGELLPPDRAGLRECERCGGAGWAPSQPPAMGSDYCQRCDGMGWYVPGNKPNA